jgi:hypothetical protein
MIHLWKSLWIDRKIEIEMGREKLQIGRNRDG